MTNNCLVTRLKAVVNNPSLPVMETMQQFTLNAITASGNDAMTDEQKWALNHFFYQIGAINNSGIYSKLQLLGLPVIAGTKAGALYNHKVGGTSASEVSANVTFADGGFTATSNNTNICSYYNLSSTTSFFAFLAGTEPKILLTGTRGSDSTEGSFAIDAIGTVNIGVVPYVAHVDFFKAANADFIPIGASINIISDNTAKCIGFDSDSVEEMNITKFYYDEIFNVGRMVPKAMTTTNAPFAFAFGTGVSAEEQLAFTTAFKDLITAFTPSNN